MQAAATSVSTSSGAVSRTGGYNVCFGMQDKNVDPFIVRSACCSCVLAQAPTSVKRTAGISSEVGQDTDVVPAFFSPRDVACKVSVCE
jgi:hypothetical protein